MDVRGAILKLIENITYLESLGASGKVVKEEAKTAKDGLNKLLQTLSEEELNKELKEIN